LKAVNPHVKADLDARTPEERSIWSRRRTGRSPPQSQISDRAWRAWRAIPSPPTARPRPTLPN